jgi:hypothetical protein
MVVLVRMVSRSGASEKWQWNGTGLALAVVRGQRLRALLDRLPLLCAHVCMLPPPGDENLEHA